MPITLKGLKELRRVKSKLRRDMTAPELLLWSSLKSRQFHSVKFRRQHGIGRYIVDFYCPEKRTVIEIDGNSHYEDNRQNLDRERDDFLKSLDLRVLRYTNSEIMRNIGDVLEDIAIKIGK